MMVDFVCENNSNKLGDTGKNQISMKRLFILSPASSKTKIILDMIDVSFNNSPDFIGVISFFGSANCSGISTKVFLRINVDHTSAFR